MRTVTTQTLTLNGRTIEYRLRRSKSAKRLRLRAGPAGVEVVLPQGRPERDAVAYVEANAVWIADQMDRIARLGGVRRPRSTGGTLLLRGVPTPVKLKPDPGRRGANRVTESDGTLVITYGGSSSATPPQRTLENWLRQRAREAITQQLQPVTAKLNRRPEHVYVMGQRTKWGNCSALQNLSFNWRLILAPDYVLRYLVTHEAAHLAVPDHSHRFWLTVQSLCPETERARQWLCAHTRDLYVDLAAVCSTD